LNQIYRVVDHTLKPTHIHCLYLSYAFCSFISMASFTFLLTLRLWRELTTWWVCKKNTWSRIFWKFWLVSLTHLERNELVWWRCQSHFQKDEIDTFTSHLNSVDPNIKFTSEVEKQRLVQRSLSLTLWSHAQKTAVLWSLPTENPPTSISTWACSHIILSNILSVLLSASFFIEQTCCHQTV
jgi:hypothetical protein